MFRRTTHTGDVETIIQAWNITDAKGKSLCIKIARQAGALRGLAKVLRLASMMLAEGEQHLESLHIQTAWAHKGASHATTILTEGHSGNVAKNINKYANALGFILEKLADDDDRRIAALAVHGIQAEAERVNSLEAILCIGSDLAKA